MLGGEQSVIEYEKLFQAVVVNSFDPESSSP